MTEEQKDECLALAQQMERVKQFPGGLSFVTDLFMAAIAEQSLTVVPAVLLERDLRIVVNNYVPPNTIVIHASMEECLRVWRENTGKASG